jgi:hypothetical protein
MNKSESIKELAAALAKAQAAMPAAKFDATNPFLKNKYASLGAIIEAARAPLAANGLSVVQLPTNEGEGIGVTTILMHASGEYIESTLSLLVGDEKGKSTAQVAGSVITYLSRYALASLLGIYADDDTDGSQPAKKEAKPAPAQPQSLMTLEMASSETTKEGVKYGELTHEDLRNHLIGINKALLRTDLTPEKREELTRKRDACTVLLASK